MTCSPNFKKNNKKNNFFIKIKKTFTKKNKFYKKKITIKNSV